MQGKFTKANLSQFSTNNNESGGINPKSAQDCSFLKDARSLPANAGGNSNNMEDKISGGNYMKFLMNGNRGVERNNISNLHNSNMLNSSSNCKNITRNLNPKSNSIVTSTGENTSLFNQTMNSASVYNVSSGKKKDLFSVLSPKTKKDLMKLKLLKGENTTNTRDMGYSFSTGTSKKSVSNYYKGVAHTDSNHPAEHQDFPDYKEIEIEGDSQLDYTKPVYDSQLYSYKAYNKNIPKMTKSSTIKTNNTKSLLLNEDIPLDKSLSQYSSPKYNSNLIDSLKSQFNQIMGGRHSKGGNNNTSKFINTSTSKNKTTQGALVNPPNPHLLNNSQVITNLDASINLNTTQITHMNLNLTSSESIPDAIFFQDKRYLSVLESMKVYKEENDKLKEEDKSLKMTVEIMKSYIEIEGDIILNTGKEKLKKIVDAEIEREKRKLESEKIALIRQNNDFKLLILKILHQVQIFEDEEGKRNADEYKYFSQLLEENNYLRSISECIVAPRLDSNSNKEGINQDYYPKNISNKNPERKKNKNLSVGVLNQTLKPNTKPNDQDLFNAKFSEFNKTIKKPKLNTSIREESQSSEFLPGKNHNNLKPPVKICYIREKNKNNNI